MKSLVEDEITTPIAVASPVFVRVKTAGPETVPTVWLPKFIFDTPMVKVGVPTKAVQAKVAESGLVEALEVKTAVAVLEPNVVGLQLMVAAQLAPGASVPQLSEMRKSPGLEPPKVTG